MTTFRATRSWGSDCLSNYCIWADLLMAKGVNAVVYRNIGRNTQDRLTASGIKVFKTDRRTVGEVVKQYRAHHLKSMELNDPSHVAPYYLFED